MKKFLFLLVAIFIAKLSAFASNYDTVFVKPNEPLSFPLEVNLEEYPYLENREVTWYVGFEARKLVGEGETEFVAKRLSSDEIKTVEGIKYYQNEDLAESFYPSEVNVRTVTVFYGHSILKSASNNYGKAYLTADEFANVTCDTIGVIHILKELKPDYINAFNDINKDNYDYYVGDTAKIKIGISSELEELDVQKYAVLAIGENKDTTLVAESDSNIVEFMPTESMNIYPAIINDMGYAVKDAKRELAVLPDFAVIELTINTIRKDYMTSKTEENVTTMEVAPYEGDSLSFVVTTNATDSKTRYNTSWNKDGQNLIEGVVAKNKNTLTINSFNPETMVGTYNCIVTNLDKNESVTISFKVTDESVTANENIELLDSQIKVYNNTLYLSNVTGKVNIVNLTGKIVKSFKANGGEEVIPLDLQSGVYIISTENGNKKISL